MARPNSSSYSPQKSFTTILDLQESRLVGYLIKEGSHRMIWVVEKQVFYHFLDMAFESVEIPIRVKFEFEVKEGRVVPDSIYKEMLYNQQALERCYPYLDPERLQRSIEDKVDAEIDKYLKGCGYLRDEPL